MVQQEPRFRLSRFPLWIAPLVSACIYVWRAIYFDRKHHGPYLIDDAYISLRHAWNFVQGHGLNFNPGERVEGYTNFLYTLLMSLAFPLGVNPEGWIKAIGIASGVGLIFAIYLIARPLLGGPAAALLALLAGWDPRLAEFSTWGLEIVFCPMLYAFAFQQLFRNRTGTAAVFFALAAMTRIETAMLAFIAFVYLVALELFPPGGIDWTPRRLWQAARRPLVFGSLFAGIFGSYFTLRFLYYGQLFPNTYYAKVGSAANSFQRGLTYVTTMLDRMGLLQLGIAAAIALPIGLAAFIWRGGRVNGFSERRLQRLFLLLAGVAYIAYIIRVGGDHFRERFIYHAYPLVLIGIPLALTEAAKIAVARIPDRWLKMTPTTRYAAIAFLFAGMTTDAMARMPTPAFGGTVPAWKAAGDWIREQAEPTDSLATCAAGLIPYASGLHTIDMFGLSDLHIAHLKLKSVGTGIAGHEKSDPVYVMSRKPRFVTTWLEFDGGAQRGLSKTFDFQAHYRLVALVDMRSSSHEGAILEIDHKPTQEELNEHLAQGREWGIWEYVPDSPPAWEVSYQHLHSRLVSPLPPPIDGVLLDAPLGHEPTHILFGPYFGFNEGTYLWEVEISHVEGDASGEICVLENVRGQDGGGETVVGRVAIDAAALESVPAVIPSTVTVGEGENRSVYSMRLFCDGRNHLRVHSVRIVRQDEPVAARD